MPPLPTNFWNQEHERLLALLAPKLVAAAKRGAQGAAAQLGLGVNYQLSDADAAQWAQHYTDQLLQQLGSTTENFVGAELDKYFSTPGATLGDLQDALTPKLAGNAARANAIAVTEVTRAYANGQRVAYNRAGVKKWIWSTNRDELVCPVCGPLNGKTVEIGEPFGADKKGKPITEPPAHPNCRCFVRPQVEVPGKVETTPEQDNSPEALPAQQLRKQLVNMSTQARRQAISDWIDARSTQRTKSVHVMGMSHPEDMHVVEWEGIKFRFAGAPTPNSTITETIDNLTSSDRVPQLLKKHTKEIVFSNQRSKDDPYWAVKYNRPGFVSLANAGDTGKDRGLICAYNGNSLDVGDTAHEMGHNLAVAIYGSPTPSVTSDFMAAVNSGEPAPTSYSSASVVEDFSESVKLFITDNSRLQLIAPKRYNVIQELLRNAGYTG